MVARREYTLDGRYLGDRKWHNFSGELCLDCLDHGGIVSGIGLKDDEFGEFSINDGIMLKWRGRLVIILLKQYPSRPSYYYQINKNNLDDLPEGLWEGNWSSSPTSEAISLLHEAVKCPDTISRISQILNRDHGNNHHPFVKMRDKMINVTLERYRQQISVVMTLILSQKS